jgi:predicted kinase
MPTCYQLIGVPGSGKSTWAASQGWADPHVVISTDNYVEMFASEMGKTYNDVFSDVMTEAVSRMCIDVRQAREDGADIIWDQTSTTVKSRKRKFNMLPDYKHIAVVFAIPEPAELTRRLASRPGKSIPWEVVDSMITGFAMPTQDEGFTAIWHAE